MNTLLAVILVALLLGASECASGHKKNERPGNDVVVKNTTRTTASQAIAIKDNFYELNNKMLPSAKLARSKRQTRVIRERPRPRKLGGRRRPPPPFLTPRLPPIARRRFPKRPSKANFHPKPPKIMSPNAQYGPPVGFFVMNLNNEIVHKSKDLGDIPPQYLDKIIPPNFISDSPQKIYAVEHDEGPPLGLGESKEGSYTPTNSYGQPVPTHHLDPQQYYPYPPSPTIESNNIPQQTETRAQINTFNRGQSETQFNPEQPPPLVYHPHFKKNTKKKKKKQQQNRQEFALEPDSPKNTYPVSSYDVPLSYVPASSVESNQYPAQQQQPPQQQQKVRPVFNVGQSFVESYTRDSNERPPQLPAKYNQNDFKTVNKSSNKKKVVYQVNTSFEEFEDEDHGLALDYPPSSDEEFTEAPEYNFGARQRPHAKRRPTKFDFIDSYEDSSISQEVYHTTPPFAVTRPIKRVPPSTTSTTTTTRNYLRTRSSTKDPLFEILDTEDLRNAYQSGRHRYKLQALSKNKEPQNFVLLSSKNSQPKATSKLPPIVVRDSGEDYKMTKTKMANSAERPATSLETDYESYELAEHDFGLRKRDFNHQRKSPQQRNGNGGGAAPRMDTSIEKIQFSDARRPDEQVQRTTLTPFSRFNPDVQFTKTFSSKIEQPRAQHDVSLWNGHPIPGNHKLAKRGGSSV